MFYSIEERPLFEQLQLVKRHFDLGDGRQVEAIMQTWLWDWFDLLTRLHGFSPVQYFLHLEDRVPKLFGIPSEIIAAISLQPELRGLKREFWGNANDNFLSPKMTFEGFKKLLNPEAIEENGNHLVYRRTRRTLAHCFARWPDAVSYRAIFPDLAKKWRSTIKANLHIPNKGNA